MTRRRWLVPAVLFGMGFGTLLGARYLARMHAKNLSVDTVGPASIASPLELHVPHAKSAVPLRAELDEGPWLKETARTNAFVLADGTTARPYSDARLVWRDDTLYIGLYAADLDIHATKKDADAPLWIEDAFHLAFVAKATTYTLDVSPLGVLTDARSVGGAPMEYQWSSGAKLDVEHDGTPNDPSDEDEEWVVALAVPLASIGVEAKSGARFGFSAHRCDAPKAGAPRVCGAYGERAPGVVLVLDD